MHGLTKGRGSRELSPRVSLRLGGTLRPRGWGTHTQLLVVYTGYTGMAAYPDNPAGTSIMKDVPEDAVSEAETRGLMDSLNDKLWKPTYSDCSCRPFFSHALFRAQIVTRFLEQPSFRWIPVFTFVRFRSFGYRRPSAAKPDAGAVGISSLLARSAA